MDRIRKLLKHPQLIWLYLDKLNILKLPDRVYIKLNYLSSTGQKLDFNNLKTFNEKLQWLKLYDRKDIYTNMVDKYEVKHIISELIGTEYIIPTIDIYERFDDINFNKLPNRFVMKCTHDSGGLVIVKDKSKFDISKAKIVINKSLKRNYYYSGREWPYKNVKPRIIIEEYMEDCNSKDLKDYKFFTFSGNIACIQVDYDRFTNHKRSFYDCDWNRLKFTTLYPTDYNVEIEKPDNLDEMKSIVKKITKYIGNPSYVRIDLYSINKRVYFGECTFYHGSGLEKFNPEEWNIRLGNLIKLPKE